MVSVTVRFSILTAFLRKELSEAHLLLDTETIANSTLLDSLAIYHLYLPVRALVK